MSKYDKKNSDVSMAIKHSQFLKDREWRNLERLKSILMNTLQALSTKQEEELTKHDLLYLISINCDYMHALNLYNYYKNDLARLKLSLHDVNINEQ